MVPYAYIALYIKYLPNRIFLNYLKLKSILIFNKKPAILEYFSVNTKPMFVFDIYPSFSLHMTKLLPSVSMEGLILYDDNSFKTINKHEIGL